MAGVSSSSGAELHDAALERAGELAQVDHQLLDALTAEELYHDPEAGADDQFHGTAQEGSGRTALTIEFSAGPDKL